MANTAAASVAVQMPVPMHSRAATGVMMENAACFQAFQTSWLSGFAPTGQFRLRLKQKMTKNSARAR